MITNVDDPIILSMLKKNTEHCQSLQPRGSCLNVNTDVAHPNTGNIQKQKGQVGHGWKA